MRLCKCAVKTTQECPLPNACDDNWSWCWSQEPKNHEVRVYGANNRTVLFHPEWSNSTAAIRGDRVLNGGKYYWEIHVSHRVFGTSIQFGIGTIKTKLHKGSFVNLLGCDEHSWGLSHKGILWHKGQSRMFAPSFKENVPTTIGLLFDGIKGTLSYYKDGVLLGVAFENIPNDEFLYPFVSSTAARTEMTLGKAKRCFTSLQDLARWATVKQLKNSTDVNALPLPTRLKTYVKRGKNWEDEQHQMQRISECLKDLPHFC